MKNKILVALDQALAHAKRFGGRKVKWKTPSRREVREVRKELNLSQVQFADRFGLSLYRVRKLEGRKVTKRVA